LRVVLASSNQGKVKEIKNILKDYNMDVIAYTDILEPFEIDETGSTFKENAIIKSETVFNKLNDKDAIVIADDSGISVEALDNRPNIYSARFAGPNATSKENLEKVVNELKEKELKSSPAHYTACISITTSDMTQTVHGWMHGEVIDEARGDNGFGYDPIFIPEGFTNTLGELDDSIKKGLSHRYKALELAKIILVGLNCQK
jgi:XTP/dITP diphosphohydrolase